MPHRRESRSAWARMGKRAASKSARRPISRVLCPAVSRGRRPFIWDARYRAPRATDPGDGAETRSPGVNPACRPYLVLLPVGFTVPLPLPEARCALTAPFHPCRSFRDAARPAVCFLWHCPWGRPRRALPGTVSPWSPDFPPPPGCPGESGRPAVWRVERRGSDRPSQAVLCAATRRNNSAVSVSSRPSTRSGRKRR